MEHTQLEISCGLGDSTKSQNSFFNQKDFCFYLSWAS